MESIILNLVIGAGAPLITTLLAYVLPASWVTPIANGIASLAKTRAGFSSRID